VMRATMFFTVISAACPPCRPGRDRAATTPSSAERATMRCSAAREATR